MYLSRSPHLRSGGIFEVELLFVFVVLELCDARNLAKMIQEGKQVGNVRLDDVARLLEVAFEFRLTNPMLVSLEMVDTEISV